MLSSIADTICTQLNSFKKSNWLNSSVWLIDGTLTVTKTPGQNEPKSYNNEGVLKEARDTDRDECTVFNSIYNSWSSKTLHLISTGNIKRNFYIKHYSKLYSCSLFNLIQHNFLFVQDI